MAGEQKSWVSRPEGKAGTFLAVAALVGGGAAVLYFWGLILPWLIMMLTNTLTAIGLVAAIVAIGWVLFDPRWRNLAFYGYKSVMRALTGLFIEIDPIGILRTYVTSLKDRLSEMDRSIESLGGQLTKLKIQIQKNEAERIHNLKQAAEAQKHGDEMRGQVTVKSRQAGRLEKSNMTLQELYDRMAKLLKVLRKMREASAVLVEDIQNEVDLKTQERAALLAGYNAFSKAKKILQGGGDEREMFDMTIEKLADDYGMKMGEIEVFMDMSKSVIQGVDLDNAVYESDALAQLEQWEKKSQNLMLGTPANTNVRVDSSPGIRVAPAVIIDNSFSDLYEESPPSNRTVNKR